jgi:hypothetical protein
MTALAGCGVAAAFERARGRPARVRVGLQLALAALVLEPIVWYARAHPYQYVYFNPLVGGLSRASRSYETDYWGLSLREAAEWMSANRSAIVGADDTLSFTTNVPQWQLEPWLDEPAKYKKSPAGDVHLYLEMYRGLRPGWHERGHPVETFGAVPGQVPFWRIQLGPASAAAKKRS